MQFCSSGQAYVSVICSHMSDVWTCVCVSSGRAVGRKGAYFGEGTGPVLLRNVNCEGSEDHLGLCGKLEFSSILVCQHHEDAGVTCDVDKRGRSRPAMFWKIVISELTPEQNTNGTGQLAMVQEGDKLILWHTVAWCGTWWCWNTLVVPLDAKWPLTRTLLVSWKALPTDVDFGIKQHSKWSLISWVSQTLQFFYVDWHKIFRVLFLIFIDSKRDNVLLDLWYNNSNSAIFGISCCCVQSI